MSLPALLLLPSILLAPTVVSIQYENNCETLPSKIHITKVTQPSIALLSAVCLLSRVKATMEHDCTERQDILTGPVQEKKVTREWVLLGRDSQEQEQEEIPGPVQNI